MNGLMNVPWFCLIHLSVNATSVDPEIALNTMYKKWVQCLEPYDPLPTTIVLAGNYGL